MTLTFIDSGVLIVAARGNSTISDIALDILSDPNRRFASSIFLKLKAIVSFKDAIADDQVFKRNGFRRLLLFSL